MPTSQGFFVLSIFAPQEAVSRVPPAKSPPMSQYSVRAWGIRVTSQMWPEIACEIIDLAGRVYWATLLANHSFQNRVQACQLVLYNWMPDIGRMRLEWQLLIRNSYTGLAL